MTTTTIIYAERFKMKNNLLICFLGIDGSGKSSLSKYLCKEYIREGYIVRYTWWLEGENTKLRKLIRKFVKSKNIQSNDEFCKYSFNKSLKGKIFEVIYPWMVIVDYLVFGLKKAFIPMYFGRKKILIFDRYFYDVIIALSEEFEFSELKKLFLFKLFSFCIPKPGLILIIDVPPEVSYLRKKDEIKSLENAKDIWERNNKFYRFLEFQSLNILRIDNNREINNVKSEILEISQDFIHGDKFE